MSVAVALDFHDSRYSPESGRFVSEDPIGFSGKDFNLYRYVGNNPNKYGDPTGQNAIIASAVAIAACAGAIAYNLEAESTKKAARNVCPKAEDPVACNKKVDENNLFENLMVILFGG